MCNYWDGKTDYKRAPINDDDKRLDEFGKWLEEGESKTYTV